MSSLDPSIIQVASFKCRADVPLGRKNVRLWELTEKQPEPSKTSKEENKEEKRIPESQQKLGPPPRRTENFP